MREARGRGGPAGEDLAERDDGAGPRGGVGRRREVFRPSRTASDRGGRVAGSFLRGPLTGRTPRTRHGLRACAAETGGEADLTNREGRAARDSRPPPDVHLRRGAKTSGTPLPGRTDGSPGVRRGRGALKTGLHSTHLPRKMHWCTLCGADGFIMWSTRKHGRARTRTQSSKLQVANSGKVVKLIVAWIEREMV